MNCVETDENSLKFNLFLGGPVIVKEDGELYGIAAFGRRRSKEKYYPQAVTFIHHHHEWISNVTGLHLN